jgi:hypothetical protein
VLFLSGFLFAQFGVSLMKNAIGRRLKAMKVDAQLVAELRKEVGLQIERVRRMIEEQGVRDSWLLSLYRLKVLKKLLTGLLEDGELVLANFDERDEGRGARDEGRDREGLMLKIAKFFKMVNPEEFPEVLER